MNNKSIHNSTGVVLSFDLDINKLKIHYSKNYNNAYYKIKQYLLKNGFEHNKDSDYINKNIKRIDAIDIIRDFSKSNDWFLLSAKKINLSPYVEVINILNELLDEVDKKDINLQSSVHQNTLSNLLSKAKVKSDTINTNNQNKNNDKDNDIEL